MNNYRVNKNTYSNPNGHNEVHKDNCQHYHSLLSFEELGPFSNCANAVTSARSKGYNADGCRICVPDCNRG